MPTTRMNVPSFAQLRSRADAPAGSSWQIFGEHDELGTVNFLTEERVLEAKQCIKTGRFFNLDCPLDAFDPPILSHRKTMKHTIFGSSPISSFGAKQTSVHLSKCLNRLIKQLLMVRGVKSITVAPAPASPKRIAATSKAA